MGFNEQLINVLSIDEGIPAGFSVTVPHHLHLATGQKLVPNFVLPNSAALVVVSVDDTNVTISNPTTEPALDVLVWVEHKHTISGHEPSPAFLWKGDQDSDSFLTQDFILFVNSTTGNDTNNGTTPATAVKTVKEALSRVPPVWGKKCQIFFASGNYPITGLLNFALGASSGTGISTNTDGTASAQSVGLQCIGTFASQVGDQQVTTITPDQFTVTVGALTSGVLQNQYRGAWLTTYDGSGNVVERNQIRSNTPSGITGTTFVLINPFVFPVSPGDTVRVERTGVTWTYDNHVNIIGASGNSSMGLKGIRLQAAGGGLNFALNGLLFVLDGVEWDMFDFSGGGWHFEGAIIDFLLSQTSGEFPVTLSAGLHMTNGFFGDDMRGGGIIGTSVMTDCFLFADAPGGFVYLRGTDALRTTIEILQGSFFSVAPDSAHPDVFDTDNSGFGGIWIFLFAATGAQLVNCVLQNSSGDAIQVFGGGNRLVSVHNLSGIGNAGYGINIFPGAMSTVQLSAAAPSTVKGALGDVSIAGVPKMYGDLPFSPSDPIRGSSLSRIDIQ